MIEFRPEGCIYEPCSDKTPNWRDMRSKFGYTVLYAIKFSLFKKSWGLHFSKIHNRSASIILP